MTETPHSHQQPLTLPYGPTKGMIHALQLMRKSTPPRIDGNYLRLNKVAPGNEYKVIGALRFLGIIDDEGKPTEKSRLLKTKGDTFSKSLQEIVRSAYRDVFQMMNGGQCSHEDIYNHFITFHALGTEMAAKTTRFFIQLCQLAEINLEIKGREKTAKVKKKGTNGNRKYDSGTLVPLQGNNGFPLLLAITPEMAAMDTEELTHFLKKLKTAIAKASEA